MNGEKKIMVPEESTELWAVEKREKISPFFWFFLLSPLILLFDVQPPRLSVRSFYVQSVPAIKKTSFEDHPFF